jgi:hypothetical protein
MVHLEPSFHKLQLLTTKYQIYYHMAFNSKLKDLHNKEFQFEYIEDLILQFSRHLSHQV